MAEFRLLIRHDGTAVLLNHPVDTPLGRYMKDIEVDLKDLENLNLVLKSIAKTEDGYILTLAEPTPAEPALSAKREWPWRPSDEYLNMWLDALTEPMTAGQLARKLQRSTSTAYFILKILRRQGKVKFAGYTEKGVKLWARADEKRGYEQSIDIANNLPDLSALKKERRQLIEAMRDA